MVVYVKGHRAERRARRNIKVDTYYQKLLDAMEKKLEEGNYKNFSASIEAIKLQAGLLIINTPQEKKLIEEAAMLLAKNIEELFDSRKEKQNART